ncbi:MAG: hybrid sensor histidine kinase/response regulator, partial [Desulfuromonas sp.]
TLPLISLAELLGLPPQTPAETRRVTVLVLAFREKQIACLIDRSLETSDLIVKDLGTQLKSVHFVSGATILADGSPALILSVPDIFQAATHNHGTRLLEQFATREAQKCKGKILVVDDSITTRTMEKNILETHGYQVAVAVSGEEALTILESRDVDLVVSDIEMPGISGFELTAQLRRSDHTRELPVVIVTSLASDEDRRKGLEVGAQSYIVKGSFDQGSLLEAVENLIG